MVKRDADRIKVANQVALQSGDCPDYLEWPRAIRNTLNKRRREKQ